MTPWLFHQNHMFDTANYVTRCHQMSIRQNQIYCQVAHSICYHLSCIYGGWPSRLNPLKLSQRQRPPWLFHQNHMFDTANYVTRCHQMSIRQNRVHCQVAHSICYHLSFIYGGWPSRLNPLKLSQRQWPPWLFHQNHMFDIANYVTRCRYDKTEYTAR